MQVGPANGLATLQRIGSALAAELKDAVREPDSTNHVAAYNARRLKLRSLGIEAPDLYGQDDDSGGLNPYWCGRAVSDELSPTPGKQRGARFYVTVIALVLAAIFVLQNTQKVEVSFLGWNGTAPLAAALLIATAAGLVLAVAAGTLRILQLRRRVKRERKA